MKGETVKIVLNRYGIKQTALAESMNVVFQNLNSILNGPDLKTSNLEKISTRPANTTITPRTN